MRLKFERRVDDDMTKSPGKRDPYALQKDVARAVKCSKNWSCFSGKAKSGSRKGSVLVGGEL